jgi:RNA polymerase sigma-70 factor (ECF subfamily)
MSDVAGVEPEVAALHARGAAAWPGVVVSLPVFVADLQRRLGAPPTAATVAPLHHDVYLAVACAAGDGDAIARCDTHVQGEVDAAALRLHASRAHADDIRGEVRRLLFISDDDRPAAITTFTGRGDLRGYVRVIAARALARRLQREAKQQPFEDDVVDVLAASVEPEVAFLRERYRADVDAALRAALGALDDRSRAVLRYHLLDGWSVDRIGERYGVHRATAARWIGNARATVGEQMRRELAARIAVNESQVDSIVAMVTSRVDVSIERLLGR